LGNALNTWPSYEVNITKDGILYERMLPEEMK